MFFNSFACLTYVDERKRTVVRQYHILCYKRNWDKLKPSIEGKLMSGANKCLSKRSVIPLNILCAATMFLL